MKSSLKTQSLKIKGTAAGVLVGRFRGLWLKQMKLIVYEQMAQEQKAYSQGTVYLEWMRGVPWFDQRRMPVSLIDRSVARKSQCFRSTDSQQCCKEESVL